MHERSSFPSFFSRVSVLLPAFLAFLALQPLLGQTPASTAAQDRSGLLPPEPATLAALALPDSPGALAALSSTSRPTSSTAEADGQIANQKDGSQPSLNPFQRPARPSVPSPTDMVIAPGQVGPRQTAGDKALGSLRNAISPFSLAGEVISAGYSQGVDSLPNYGRDSSAFGQRVGAAVARGTSQNLLSTGLMASLLHQDPRYYQLGSKQNILKRVVYAGTRPVIGRTDGGRTTPNFATLSGYLEAAALTQLYYPARNQGFTPVLRTWGGGIGGNALGYEVTEFLPDVLQFLHLKRVTHP